MKQADDRLCVRQEAIRVNVRLGLNSERELLGHQRSLNLSQLE